MIELSASAPAAHPTRLLVVGLGSAGGNMLDRLMLDGFTGGELLAVNTDVQALSGCVATAKLQIGQRHTHGLGAGGDPEVGANVAEDALEEISAHFAGQNAVVFLVGLGGGTGSGGLSIFAEQARAQGARVIVIATLPFGFEGNRRRAQALDALAALEGQADLLLCFENDRMSELVSARTGAQEAFGAVEQTLAECVRALSAVSQVRGLLHAGLDEICSAFAGEGLRALFGFAEAQGGNRVHEAVEAALRGPLLDRGRQLKEADSAVIHLTGGPDFTLNEAQIALEEVRKHLPADAQLYCGLAIDHALGATIRLTILASTYVQVSAEAVPAPARVRQRPAPAPRELPPAPAPAAATHHDDPLDISVELPHAIIPSQPEPSPEETVEEEAAPVESVTAEEEEYYVPEPPAAPAPAPTPRPIPRMRPLFAPIQNQRIPRPATPPPAPEPEPEEVEYEPEPEPLAELEPEYDAEPEPESEPELLPAPVAKPGSKQIPARNAAVKQEQMLFDTQQRGRFEKSEPTIVDGENLDVPTFMRRNVNTGQ